jgi:hypothetical protein
MFIAKKQILKILLKIQQPFSIELCLYYWFSVIIIRTSFHESAHQNRRDPPPLDMAA